MSQMKQLYEQTAEYELAEKIYNFDQAVDGLERTLSLKPGNTLAVAFKEIKDRMEQLVAQSIICRKCSSDLKPTETGLCPACVI